jgi:hypothetical protein
MEFLLRAVVFLCSTVGILGFSFGLGLNIGSPLCFVLGALLMAVDR